MKHAGAVEADLLPDVDLTDLWRGRVSIRRVWIVLRHRVLVEVGDELMVREGTALARSITGELGDWSRLDRVVHLALGADVPESKEKHEWKRAQQTRLRELRESRKEA